MRESSLPAPRVEWKLALESVQDALKKNMNILPSGNGPMAMDNPPVVEEFPGFGKCPNKISGIGFTSLSKYLLEMKYPPLSPRFG